MKRILYIAPHNLRKRTGGSLATLAYYNALVYLNGEMVDMMMPAEFNDDTFINVIPVKKRSFFKVLLSGSLHRYKSAVNNYLMNHAKEYEMCIINGGLYAGDMMDFLHDCGLKIIVIHHNFEREYAMDNKSILTFGGLTPFLIIRNERRAYLKAEVNCFLTENDEKKFMQYYGLSSAKSYQIGVFEPYEVQLPTLSSRQKKNIVITGSMNSVQTMCGITDVHEHYYDIIRNLCPDWELVIAGRSPRHEVYNLQKENPNYIKVIPDPENMDEITAPASIFLCPTNVGGGLKLRVMDGLRMGLPVLVHRVSARGYDVFFSKPYFKIYDDRESFSKGLCELLEYISFGYERSKIQKDYLRYFSFKSGCDRIKSIVRERE